MSRLLRAILTAALLLTAVPAWAGTPEDPELVDPCGIEESDATELATNHAPPWADVCTAWFETLTGEEGPPAIRLTITFAGDITERPLAAAYDAGFWVGDCRYAVEHTDEGTAGIQGEQAGDRLSVRCPAATEPDCPYPVLVGCGTAWDTSIVPLPAGIVAEDGRTLVTTLVFADALAPWASAFGEGAELRSLSITAAGFQGLVAGGYCYGSTCGTNGADVARAQRSHVVEPGEGPAVTGPLVALAQPTCVDGPVAEGSAQRPHFSDAPGDYQSVLGTPETEADGYDLKAAWFSETADGGVALSVLPWGAEHTTGHLRYSAALDGWTVAFDEAADGSWSGRVYVERYITDLEEWATGEDPTYDIDVTHDPVTGTVTTVLPEAILPGSGGQLRLTDVRSWETPAGGIAPVVVGPASVSPGGTYAGADDGRFGQHCTATR